MTKKSRGELEDEFTKAMIHFEKDYFGRGPVEARTRAPRARSPLRGRAGRHRQPSLRQRPGATGPAVAPA